MSKPAPAPAHPLVSIVMPSFNQGEFIAEAIDSVLSQDYPRIEFVVMDGGSTDSTLDLLRGYGDRIRWTSGPDAGQSDAIHRGFLASSGKYLAWLNSDDRYVPGAIGAAVEAMEADPSAALLYGRGEYIDRDGAVTGPSLWLEPWNLDTMLGTVNFVLQPATFFRRDAYLAIGGLDTALHYCMDYDLWLRLGSTYPVLPLARLLAQARAYGETKSSTGALPRLQEMERVVRHNGGSGLPKGYRREMYVELRAALAVAGRKRQLGRAARLAVRITPYAAGAATWRLRRLRAGR